MLSVTETTYVLIDGQIATDSAGAKKFLGGIGDARFEELVKTRILRRLGRDWYSYRDLVEAIETLRLRRDGEGTLKDDGLPNTKKQGRAGKGKETGSHDEYRIPRD